MHSRGYVPMTREEEKRFAQFKPEEYQQLLDSGYGECVLKRDDAAEIVANALKHFDGIRYRLWAWCVMPNHVHAAVHVFEPHTLSSVLHSWKSYSAKEVNKILGLTGVLWQAESYDHLIRDEADFQRCVRYILENPARAGLASWKWVGSLAWPCRALRGRHRREADATWFESLERTVVKELRSAGGGDPCVAPTFRRPNGA